MNFVFYSFTLAVLLVIIFAFLIYILKKITKTQLQQIFAVNLVLLITICIFMFLQIQFSKKLNIAPIYFDYYSYIGIVFLPVSLFFTTKIFINTKIKFKPIYILLFIIPVLSLILLWTNDVHHLFFKSYSVQLSNCEFGPFFIINQIYSYTLYFISIFNLINFFKNNSGLFTEQIGLIIVGTLVPFSINILGFIGLINITVYITPIALAISIICFALALFKFQLINTLPISLTKIVNRISDGYVVLNDKNIITDYNSTFLKMFDLENTDLKSMHFFDIISHNNFETLNEDIFIKALKSVIDSNETLSFELNFDKLKKYYNFEISSITSDNIFIGSIILVKDYTQHKNDLEVIKSNQDILVGQERLVSLGQMIGGIAHNLKTPIFSIAGATEGLLDLIKEYKESVPDPNVTLEDHLDIANDMENWVNKIKNHISYMSDIITTVKGQAVALSNSSSESFTIEELIKRISILMKSELQKHLIELNVQNELEESIVLNGNINSLVQVINNLISNSIQSYNDKTNEKIDLIISKTENILNISITDYGCGIPEHVQNNLFKKMITTKGKNGTGIGLFMSYSNIKAQFNGDIKFKSEVGKGTTFVIIIPISD